MLDDEPIFDLRKPVLAAIDRSMRWAEVVRTFHVSPARLQRDHRERCAMDGQGCSCLLVL